MATIPPINYGALKVSFPANLPRNEKDLICMLLAGRLKDLWNGKLICVQLAIDDLVKDMTGISPLQSLRAQLLNLKSSLDGFKRVSGYDQILGGVNKALGQVSTVFSLGGLCPSPVSVPKIPDILATLNQNLFGQANGILNALAQASNPKVCLGGGPKGFGLDWSKVDGNLKLLKDTVNEFKRNPAGLSRTVQAFESNIGTQTKRLNSELKRLEKNLADPLGISEKRNTASAVQRAKAISDGYPVKDKNGITYKNPARTMIPGEVDGVLSRTDPNFTSPVSYVTKPVYDYCGNITGYTREVVTGDPNYLGYDTIFTGFNVATPTTNPTASFKDYDFFFKEENGRVVVYNTAGEIQSDIRLERGQHYRIGIQISSALNLGIYDVDDSFWGKGLTVTQEPEYGKGFEITTLEQPCSSLVVELDWAVNIENPTTPNLLIWKANNGQQGNIIVGGPTAIPEVDKTYDVNNAVRKSLMFLRAQQFTDQNISVWEEQLDTTKIYSATASASGVLNFSSQSTLTYGSGYSVIVDEETLDSSGSPIDGNKILKIVQPWDNKFIVSKLYYSEISGLDIHQYSSFITANLSNEEDGYQLIASLKFTKIVEFLNDTRLPCTDYNSYMLTLADGTKLSDTEQLEVELVNPSLLKIHLTENRTPPAAPGQFLISFEIGIDPADADRSYQTTNPVLQKFQVQFKGSNFNFGQTINLTSGISRLVNWSPAAGNLADFIETGNFTGWIADIQKTNLKIDSNERNNIVNNTSARQKLSSIQGLTNNDITQILNNIVDAINRFIDDYLGENTQAICFANQQTKFTNSIDLEINGKRYIRSPVKKYSQIDYGIDMTKLPSVNDLANRATDSFITAATNNGATITETQKTQINTAFAGVIEIAFDIIRSITDKVDVYDYIEK